MPRANTRIKLVEANNGFISYTVQIKIIVYVSSTFSVVEI
jgi:hypothetical protein